MEENFSSWVFPAKPNFFVIPWSAYNGKIPFILTDLVKGILARQGKSNFRGLFRESSSTTELDNFTERLSSGQLRDFPDELDALLLSNLMKRYIKSITEIEPLISQEITQQMLDIMQNNSENGVDVAAVKSIIDNLDESHKVTLSYISYVFKQFGENPETGMNVQSFSSILGAILIPVTDPNMYKKTPILVQFLMDHIEEIFDKSLYSEERYQTSEDINNMLMPYIDIDDLAIEVQRRAIRESCSIQVDYEYMDSILGLKYPTA